MVAVSRSAMQPTQWNALQTALGHELPSGLPIRKAVFHDKAALRPSQNKRLDSSQTRLRQSQYLAQ